jgi:ATP-dependent helicase/nuclease subunit B
MTDTALAPALNAAPGVFTIEAGEIFVDVLARGILHQVGESPEALARVRVLLPTRRACRSLREAFLRLSQGRPLLLPVMTPLGDVDEDELTLEEFDADDALELPPAMGALNRQTLLANYVLKMDGETTPEQAVRLAGELAKLVDQVHTEGLDLSRLPQLVQDRELSAHWDKTVQFLAIVGETWPKVLKAEGALDPAQRRDLLLRARAQAWKAKPPAGWVIAAGSTGTIPATAELLHVIAHLPQGSVVLPGLDVHAPDAVWDNLDASHPQYGMAKLLDKLGVARNAVAPWPGCAGAPSARRALIDLAMVPAEATHLWRNASIAPQAALDGLTRIECAGAREEAATIALILRHALNDQDQHPGRTAALITPDRALARRVAVEMRRWGVDIDDSAGQPLDQTPPGAFFNLVADMVAEQFHPVSVLACLKHPLAAGGMTTVAMRASARALEAACLRGARPGAGLAGLQDRLRTMLRNNRSRAKFQHMGFDEKQVNATLRVLLTCTKDLTDALAKSERTEPAKLLTLHVQAAEALARTDAPIDERRLWTGDAGEALSAFIAEAHEALTRMPPLQAEQYPALIKALMTGRPVRPRYASHPRIHIWGLLEARLQRADILVLGGLNEGIWPTEPEASPWMSRPMMRQFGLPLPERRVGLSAHDFVQAICGPRVFITRAQRQGTSPQVQSRWLTRLDTVLGDAAPPLDASWPTWAASLTRWDDAPQPCPAPKPAPPVAARPRQLSVTAIEKWIRDPYSIYAQYVLRLEPLDLIDADASAADKGNVIHAALERFISQYMKTLPDDALGELLRIGEIVFAQEISSPGVRAFWWPRFKRIARWFVEFESKRRADGFLPLLIEGKGRIQLDGRAGPFTLTAKADRIDQGVGSGLTIVDYKTGQPPSANQVGSGLTPQLPLEGLIAKGGGFEGVVKNTPIDDLLYVRMSGGYVPGEEKPIKLDAEEAVQNAHEGLARLIHKYDDERTPYLARPRVQFESNYGDFDHLARIKEWRNSSDGGDE